MPDFRREKSLSKRCAGGPVAGIDEAGRGPLAGPVVAAAVVLDLDRLPRRLRAGIDDSKVVPRERREALCLDLRRLADGGRARIGVGMASVEEIDRVNILRATYLAMARAVAALAPLVPAAALVDGNRAPPLGCPVETVVDGDALSLSIAAASIVAKVTRDRMMRELARAWPGYGWESNVGYSTPDHYAGLDRLGPSPHHRRSFAPIRNLLNPLALDGATRPTQSAFPWRRASETAAD